MIAFFPHLSRRAGCSSCVRSSFETRKLDVVDLTPRVYHKCNTRRNAASHLILSAGLDVHYFAVVQADGSKLLALGPILADLDQVSIIWNSDFGFRLAKSGGYLRFGCAHLDCGKVFGCWFLARRLLVGNYRLRRSDGGVFGVRAARGETSVPRWCGSASHGWH